jgi:hypothetical protein
MLRVILVFSTLTAGLLLVYLAYSMNESTGACCTGIECQPRSKAQCSRIGGSFLADTTCATAPCTLAPTPSPTPAVTAELCDPRFMSFIPLTISISCENTDENQYLGFLSYSNFRRENSGCQFVPLSITLSIICDGTPCTDIPGAINDVIGFVDGSLSCTRVGDDLFCPDVNAGDTDGFTQGLFRFKLNNGFTQNVTIVYESAYETGETYVDPFPDYFGTPC